MSEAAARPSTLFLIYVTGFISAGAFVLVQLVVPLWAQALGAPPVTLGLIVGAGALLPSLFIIPVGALVDRRGARQVLALSAALAGLTTAAFAIAPNYWWLVPIQVAGGIGRTAAWVASQAYLIQIIPSGDLPRRTANYSAMTSSGTFLFPMLGGLLVDAAGHGTAFAFGAASYALLLLALVRLPSLPGGSSTATWNLWQAYQRAGAMALRAGVLLLLWGTVVRLALGTVRSAFLPLYLLGLEYSPSVIGLLIGAGNLCGVLGTPATARLQALFGAGVLVFLTLGASAIAMWATPSFTTLVPLALLGLVWGAGIGMSLPPMLTLVARQTAPAERGLGVALRNTGNEWSIMLSPIAFGLVVEGAGLAPALALAGAVLFLCCGAGLLWSRQLKT